MKRYEQIQQEVIEKYNITIDENSKCWSRTHIHIKTRKICKWKRASSINSTFTLLHEIGHCENNNSKMRRCEQEYYATVWAIEEAEKYGLEIPQDIIDKYQRYIYMELDRGIRKGGSGYPTKEEMKLKGEMKDGL